MTVITLSMVNVEKKTLRNNEKCFQLFYLLIHMWKKTLTNVCLLFQIKLQAMKSRTTSLKGSPETTASSSTRTDSATEYSESDDDSDRHSTTSSEQSREGENQCRKRHKELSRRESDTSDDDRLPAKFHWKNDRYSKRLAGFLL